MHLYTINMHAKVNILKKTCKTFVKISKCFIMTYTTMN